MRKKRRRNLAVFLVLVVAIGGFAGWLYSGLRPMSTPGAPKIFIRYEKPTRLASVLKDLEARGVIRSAAATQMLGWFTRTDGNVAAGSYSVGPGQNGGLILWDLRRPIRQIVRLPETDWAKRTANVLELHHVAQAADYMALVHDPSQFANDVPFPLPNGSLEGYLYPDRYDLPPLLGARRVILKQLKAFEKNVWDARDKPKDLQRTLILASLVQLEAGKDVDRPMIAGVIENRLKQKMPLQIDATILYALQKWRLLKFKDYRSVKSPYNTYLVKGLPPGPICSPDEKDIEAAMHPAQHKFLYYVAMPDGDSIYSITYKDHLKNIKLRKAAMKAIKS